MMILLTFLTKQQHWSHFQKKTRGLQLFAQIAVNIQIVGFRTFTRQRKEIDTETELYIRR